MQKCELNSHPIVQRIHSVWHFGRQLALPTASETIENPYIVLLMLRLQSVKLSTLMIGPTETPVSTYQLCQTRKEQVRRGPD